MYSQFSYRAMSKFKLKRNGKSVEHAAHIVRTTSGLKILTPDTPYDTLRILQ